MFPSMIPTMEGGRTKEALHVSESSPLSSRASSQKGPAESKPHRAYAHPMASSCPPSRVGAQASPETEARQEECQLSRVRAHKHMGTRLILTAGTVSQVPAKLTVT